MRFKFALPQAIVAATLCLPVGVAAQSRQVKDLGVGKLLVAPRNAPDPIFAKTVVLLVEFDENGALGLLINHPTGVPISRALDQLKAANNHSDPVYLGGPVDVAMVLALLRASGKPDEARRVVGDVYLVSTRSLLEKTLTSGTGPGEFRAYMGYCGWGAGQLENEMNRGGWYIFDGDAKLVFDSDPESVWSRLVARTEQKIARRRPPAGEGWEMNLAETAARIVYGVGRSSLNLRLAE
jgi:putative transcriptional regulator